MKKPVSRLAALLLAAALTLSPISAWASEALGTELHTAVTVLGPDVTVTTGRLWSASKSDLRTERYLTWLPSAGISPRVVYGDTVLSKNDLTAMAHALEDQGLRVLGGVNGDYFVVASGEPLGLVVTEGVMRSSASYHLAVGFLPDGTAFIGKPDLTISADLHGHPIAVFGGYNKARTKDTFVLFNGDYGSRTAATGDGWNLILRPVEVPADYEAPTWTPPEAPEEPEPTETPDPAGTPGEPDVSDETEAPDDPEAADAPGDAPETDTPSDEDTPDPPDGETPDDAPAAEPAGPTDAELDKLLTDSVKDFKTLPADLSIGGTVQCVVEDVIKSAGKVDIPKGRFVLSIGAVCSEYLVDQVTTARRGSVVTLSVTAPDPRWNEAETAIGAFARLVEDGKEVSGLETDANPRTAVGIREDGAVILYTIDGRRAGYSVGAGMDQVARRLIELDCVDAVALDGGGSTTFGVTDPTSYEFSVTSRPSEGVQRGVTNGLFLVSALERTGVLGSLHILPQDAVVLSGTPVELSAWGVDTSYRPLYALPGGVTYTARGAGTVEDTTFLAGDTQGEAVVTGALYNGASGEARFTVVDTPTSIAVKNEKTGQEIAALSLEPGEEVSLTAVARWWGLHVESVDTAYSWAADENIGKIDEEGLFTAGLEAGRGYIAVSAGKCEARIPVLIGGHVRALTGCEDLTGFASGTAQLTTVKTEGLVPFGRRCLAVEYPLEGEEPPAFDADLAIDPKELCLGAWLYGDGSALSVALRVELEDGTEELAYFPSDPFTGWKQLFAPLPLGATRVTGFVITPAEDSTGTLYMDQLVAANGLLYDEEPPAVRMEVKGAALTAHLADNIDQEFPASRISLTRDGLPIPFEVKEDVVTAQVEEDPGALHRYTLTVTDAWGNIGRGTVEVQPEEPPENPFGDTDGHWAERYITYLHGYDVARGGDVDGALCYFPARNVTRGEFAALTARWMRLDLSLYEEAALPFADTEDIPVWFVPEVAALYTQGIFNGSRDGDDLYARPNDPITRAEAMTMLGRVQARGFALREELFLDDGAIPAWARQHIYTLAGQGVVSGYEGSVRPNDPVTRAEVAKLLSSLW